MNAVSSFIDYNGERDCPRKASLTGDVNDDSTTVQ